ncbi:zinc finger protein 131 isoform X3 [Erythrolamprus reginae]|uniref:zinc finger protein 131 isoform X3 n=2 Tax=Erythrolamprus reginae TaxID=121349 RepID=UPI00396CF7B5
MAGPGDCWLTYVQCCSYGQKKLLAMEAEETMDCIQEFPEHYKVIMDRLNEQREQDQFTDITLIVDGVSNMAFRHLIEFTYTAKLMVQGEEEANDVWKAAEYLQMLEAIKALEIRNKENASSLELNQVQDKNKATKRKIAETSNVITETLPCAESEPVEIEVEIAEGALDVEENNIESLEEVASGEQPIKYIQTTDTSDDSALALLADITSKFRHGERKNEIQEECDNLSDPMGKHMEGIEIMELQLSHVNNLFHCEKCNRTFKFLYHFKEHMKTHSTESYKCDLCNKRYLRESALKQHLTCYHLDEGGTNKKQRPGKKIHVCQYCDKQFDHFGHFKEHLRKHTGEKPFECPNCHERFARNSTLKCHLTACQSGAGAKKGRKKLYECQVCNSVFNSWDQFKDHLVIHTGDKPNHCTLCDVWFMQGSELRRHLQDMHNISERIISDDILPVDSDSVASMTIIEQVEQVHVLPVIQVQVDPAQVTVEQVHPDLIQNNQEKHEQIAELQEQVEISYLEVEHIQTEQGTEVHMEELDMEHVNQLQMEEVQAQLIEEHDLEQGESVPMDEELTASTSVQVDVVEAHGADHEESDDLKTQPIMATQEEKVES